MRTTATIGLLLVLLFGGISRLSAQEITFQASVDRNTIAVGEHVKLSITLTNARGSFGAPDLGGMMVVQGPFDLPNMVIINGQMRGSLTRTWLLTATRPGRYTIGPAQAKVGGGTIQTEPIVVEVTKGNATRPGDPQAALGQQRDPNLFTTISLSRNKGYVGEQVIATYMLYSRYANLQSVPKEMPKISNAWVEEVDLGEPRWEDKLETINGVQYRVAVLRKQGFKFDIMSTSFFLSRRSIKASPQSGMPVWQDNLYISLTKSATDATSFFQIPTGRVVEVGTQVTV